jgi:membrane protein
VEHLPPVLRFLVWVSRFIYAVVRDAIVGNLPMRAMGLVYITILSIVPIIAISFSVLKGFGVHYQLEPILNKFLSPLGVKGTELSSQLIGFVDNVQGDVLAGVGLMLLFFTTISMAQKIEDSFNYVWRVERNRSVARRLTDYLSVIVLGPVIMVTALALISSVKSNAIVQGVADIAPISATLLLLGKLAPYLLVSLGFTCVYWFLPNTRVNSFSALIGGLTGGLLWAFTSALFTAFVANSIRTMNIYAGFAVVIVALIWLYICWLILLVGAQVAFYFQNPDYIRLGYRQIPLGNRNREQIALSIMLEVADRFREGRQHPAIADVAAKLALPGLLLSPVVTRLESAGLITRSAKDRLLPRRDPNQIEVNEVMAAIRDPQMVDVFPEGRWPPAVTDVTRKIDAAVNNALQTQSLYDLLDTESPKESRSSAT